MRCNNFASAISISHFKKYLFIFAHGYEFQVLAPAYWTATLHRGGVLRVKTRQIAHGNRQARLDNYLAHRSYLDGAFWHLYSP